jgi:Flp pilus assembly pilin Flp
MAPWCYGQPLRAIAPEWRSSYDSVSKLPKKASGRRRKDLQQLLQRLWFDDDGQDVAEYAVMLAVVLVIVVGTIRLIGANANNVFSSVSSSIAQ